MLQTGIFKTPVSAPVMVRKLNLDGDRQSDLSVHGGPDKAVYSYDVEDYRYWKSELDRELSPGMFGENLTTEGLLDRNVCSGDVRVVGGAVLQAVQPRLPCYKLSVKFQDDQMPKRFVRAGRWGIYFRVIEEGIVRMGDSIAFASRDPRGVTIDALAQMAIGQAVDPELIRRALEVPCLAEGWRDSLQEKLTGQGEPA